MKRNKAITALCLSLFLSMLCGSAAGASDSTGAGAGTIEKTYAYTADSKDEKEGDFKETITNGGKKYKLSGIRYEVVKQNPVTKEKELTAKIVSEPAKSKDAAVFEDTIEKDGVTYSIDRSSIVMSEEAHTQEVTAYEDFENYADASTVPASKTVTVTNEVTGAEETVDCALQNVVQQEGRWQNSYIDITFQDYDAGVFSWNGVRVSKESLQSNPLAGYEAELLSSVGLDSSQARVGNTYWLGGEYTQGNTVCRDARADIQRFVPVYRANYSGEITMGTYEAAYKGKTIETVAGKYSYDMQAVATYEAVRSPFIYIACGVALAAALFILILFLIGRKKKEKKEEEV